MRLDLKQNALHTLHHAIEHMWWAESDLDEVAGRQFDEGSLPSAHGRKFALLHLIQAAELLLKSYIERVDPDALFVRPGSPRTIDLATALDLVLARKPTLLSPDQVSLLLEAKRIRNNIEHYRFHCEDAKLEQLCTDFLGICLLFGQDFLSVNLVEEFSWDYLREEPDPVGNYLGTVLSRMSDIGRLSTAKAGELWAAENPSERVFLCLYCGTQSASASQGGICMGCGAENSEDVSQLVQELEETTTKLLELRALRDKE